MHWTVYVMNHLISVQYLECTCTCSYRYRLAVPVSVVNTVCALFSPFWYQEGLIPHWSYTCWVEPQGSYSQSDIPFIKTRYELNHKCVCSGGQMRVKAKGVGVEGAHTNSCIWNIFHARCATICGTLMALNKPHPPGSEGWLTNLCLCRLSTKHGIKSVHTMPVHMYRCVRA